jgi:hypothetical protein
MLAVITVCGRLGQPGHHRKFILLGADSFQRVRDLLRRFGHQRDHRLADEADDLSASVGRSGLAPSEPSGR